MAFEVSSSEHSLYAEAIFSYHWSSLDVVAEGRWTACQLERFEVAVRPGIVQSRRVCLTETVSAAKTPQLR
jgi:hypothetical protein